MARIFAPPNKSAKLRPRNPPESEIRTFGISRSTWLITSPSPGGGEMSKHGLSPGNIAALLARLSELKQKAFARTGQSFQAGLDGFWIIRVLQSEGVESHVVEFGLNCVLAAPAAAKTNRIDAKPWCALCWRTNAANRGSAPWSGRRRQRKKTAADVAVSARR